MKLRDNYPRVLDFNPTFVDGAGERKGVGMLFDCPCGCGTQCFVSFKNPLDGGAAMLDADEPSWQRYGEHFAGITLRPSIHRAKEKGGCGWHGWITEGKFEPAV